MTKSWTPGQSPGTERQEPDGGAETSRLTPASQLHKDFPTPSCSPGADRKQLEPAPSSILQAGGGRRGARAPGLALAWVPQADLIAQARGSPSWGHIPR